MNWRHLIAAVHDGAMNMSAEDALRVGLDQANMLQEAAEEIRMAVFEREGRVVAKGTRAMVVGEKT